MSNYLGVTETLALLESLKGIVQEFVAKEDSADLELRARASAEAKTFEAAVSEQSAQLNAALAALGVASRARAESCHARWERRKYRIDQAAKAAKKQAIEKIDEQEGRKKYKLQEGAIEAERRKEADIASAAAEVAEFQARLSESRASFASLEQAARSAFRGYGKFLALLSPTRSCPEPDLRLDEHQLFEELQRLRISSAEELNHFRKKFLPRLFQHLRLGLLTLLFVLGFAGSVPILHQFGVRAVSYSEAGAWVFSSLAIIWLLYQVGKSQSGATALAIADSLAKAVRLDESCLEKSRLRCEENQKRIKSEYESKIRSLDETWKQTLSEAADARRSRPQEIDEKSLRISQKNGQRHQRKIEELEQYASDRTAQLRQAAATNAQRLAQDRSRALAKTAADEQARWVSLEFALNERLAPVCGAIQATQAAAAALFPDWSLPAWDNWTPPGEFKNAAKFASLEVDIAKLAQVELNGRHLALPCPSSFPVPLLAIYPLQGSILFETSKTGATEAIAAINNILFRLLSTTPPGKVSFTILDPVSLGQSFAGIMHLADYEESLINSRIWTQPGQIDEKLAELNEHMEKVIQMYLRNEYATIAEYNARAGAIAEKYHLLVVAGFPVNFTDTAIRRLLNICSSGARCGVHTLIQWDLRLPLPQGFVPDELRKTCVRVAATEKGFELPDWRRTGTRLALDPPPAPEFVTTFLHKVGRASKDSNRVEVPFEQVAPSETELWTGDTTQELRVAIGRSGATKLQYLAIGKGTRQHGLIAGKTGSGKSTLFHVIITNLALWCGPDQVEFYLVDFKKGVEFKCYATHRLPHARVVAIESDREFGLSVLQRLDVELRRRGDVFRQLGVQDLSGYKRAGGSEPMPRSLLLIDEFQEFFVEEDRISQGAAVLLDRIVRQGRAFGIHVLLGSQTLGGAYTLARATIGQMVIRIALQCNEADALLIMDQDNPAPRLLSRPGEGIYNDAAGAIEGNSPFQAVWLSDETRDTCLEKVRQRAARDPVSYPGPFVFEGNVPADIHANPILAALLETTAVTPPDAPRIWLGAPNSIKGPTEARFPRQSGSHLLIVGQNEEGALAILSTALVSLAAQYPVGTVRFVLLDNSPPGSTQREYLDRVIKAIPHEILQSRDLGISPLLSTLADDLKKADGEPHEAWAGRTFVFIHGLQTHNKLRQEDEFSFSSAGADSVVKPSAVLLDLITEGPSRGFHVIANCDTYNNLNRFVGRKTLSEFQMRAVFQMSAGDSASLIDTPAAGSLGLHRAIFYNDREGSLETFRPYALPGSEWIESAARQLVRLAPHPVPPVSC